LYAEERSHGRHKQKYAIMIMIMIMMEITRGKVWVCQWLLKLIFAASQIGK